MGQNNVTAALLPCPFCGSRPLSIEAYRNKIKVWSVFCHVGEKCSMEHVEAVGIDETEAATIWNTRESPAASGDLRERIARAMCCPDGCQYPDRCCAQSVQRLAHNGKQLDAILATFAVRAT